MSESIRTDPAAQEGGVEAPLSPIKRAIVEIRDLRARLDEAEGRTREPIAVVGMAVRLPGDIETPDDFWSLLRDGRDAIREVPPDRWRIDDFYDPDSTAPGKMSTRFGGFLSRPDLFDARFFGITPREAAMMDPQQRLLLEVAWEALENAGQAPDRLTGHPTGVFVGLSAIDYLVSEIKFSPIDALDAYVGSGGSPSVASGRLAYVLGLQGPSLTVDTACSSSLSAVHLGCQSLRLRECRMAIVGGVNLILLPEFNVNFSKAGMMAADGRCKTFDRDADGYVRSEGCGVVVLKRLSEALDNRDRILGVIRGSALNQDGRSSGLTVPNGQAQEAVIREAMTRAGVRPAEVSYIEAHGTGTSLGDPIELRALGRVFAEGRADGARVAVGSVKTNLGHLEAAAGVTGLIKVLLAFQHGEIPPHLHLDNPTPHVEWNSLPLDVPRESKPWAAGGPARIAGVSSFAFSGANAHVIVEEPPSFPQRGASPERPLHVLTVSGRTEAALRESMARIARHLTVNAQPLADVCFTANAGRAHFAHRAAVIAATSAEAAERLRSGSNPAEIRTGVVPGGAAPDVAFVFDGMGRPRAGRARLLYETQPAFHAALDRCDELARAANLRSVAALHQVVPGGRLDDADVGAADFTLQYALAAMWLSWGVQPRMACGRGTGALAAGCAAGAIALADAFALATGRFQERTIEVAPLRFALVSHRTGDLATQVELADPSYWASHARVEIASAFDTMRARGVCLYVDIGDSGGYAAPPSAVSAQPVVRLRSHGATEEDDWAAALSTLSELYVRGVNVNWTDFDRGYERARVELPTYPFQRSRHWSDAVQPRRGGDAASNAVLDDSLYELVWRQVVAGGATGPGSGVRPGTTWIVVSDVDGPSATLADRLRAAGCRTLVVSRGPSYEKSGEDAFSLDLLDAEQVARLWCEAVSTPISAIVYFAEAALNANTSSGAAVQDAAVRVCGSLLHVAQAAIRLTQPAAAVPRLFVVTDAAHAVGGGEVNLVHAPLAGLAAAIGSEHPDLQCTLVDLDRLAGAEAEASLWHELSGGSRADRLVAWRRGQRFVARLQRWQGTSETVSIRADATYLIAGGTGGLGLQVAQWLAGRGARHLVLVGRRGAVGSAAGAVQALIDAGCQVRVVAGSVADERFTSGMVETIASSMPPLAGVVQAAGILDDGVLQHQTPGRFATVMAPKVAGAWNLHRATLHLPLDFFVLFSSFASLAGSAGQSNYAAANAFLDGLAHHRRRRGLAATSVNWGAWRESGMAAGAKDREQRRWAAEGVGAIDTALGLQAFGRLASTSAPAQAAVVSIDWPAFLRDRSMQSSLFAGFAPAMPPASAVEVPALAAAWAASPESDRHDLVLAHVRGLVVEVLALDTSERIDAAQGLVDLGMDSLMALELRNRLQRSVGQALPPTVVFDHPSLADLTTFLERDVLAPAAAREGASTRGRSSPAVAEAASTGIAAEPVAIVGIGCRMPGGADSPERFWQLLREGVDAITEVPADRWDKDAYYDPDPNAPGKMVTRWGGFVSDADRFDPQFFGIAPREAASMDPQQRLLLEVCWEALEHAGEPPDRLHGSRTGVFVGISGSDYSQLQMRRVHAQHLDAHFGTGGAVSVAAGRLAYSLGLQGPALAVDTACSSSLVAVHLACQALRNGECSTALAGGVNLILSPETNVILSRARMMSPQGRCSTFDAAADGYVRSDGCGVVVLKRLSDAIAAGDRVLAVIRGTAVNQDGRSGGLTVPNGPAQEALIRQALVTSGVAPADVDYIEAHGTGTSLGDPIEVRALSSVFSSDRLADRPLQIGSVKTNVGHLEAAAGIAGLIKVVLALQHEQIPPHLHLREVNPHISLEAIPAVIPTTVTAWRADGRPRIAGVSSFGFSGTNAHAVIEEAPRAARAPGDCERPRHVLALSAKSPGALGRLAARYQALLASEPASIADLAFTANAGRAHFAYRLAVAGGTAQELHQALAACAPALGSIEPSDERPKIAFLFTGQGAQYPGMARSLFEMQPTFRQAVEQCDAVLRGQLERPLLDVLFETTAGALLNQTQYTQPALFAVEYALARMWQSWGIEPSAVMGHSVGEFVAATIAGIFSLEDGLRLIATRGRLMQALPAGGAMAAVLTGEARLGEIVAEAGGTVSIAALNAPDNVVISGAAADVEEVCKRLAREHVETRPLAVSHAFHSALVEPMLDEFERLASAVTVNEPCLPFVSNLTGRFMARGERCGDRYWRRHAREAVRFADGMQALADAGYRTFLEVGPHPTLLGLGRRTVSLDHALWLPSLRRGSDEWQQVLDTLVSLYSAGAKVDWHGFDRDYERTRVTAPTYPFERERYWLADPGRPSSPRSPVAASPGHPLLGHRVRSRGLEEIVYESELCAGVDPWLKASSGIGSGADTGFAVCLEMALAAAGDADVVHDLSYLAPLDLSGREPRVVQLIVTPGAERRVEVVSEASDGDWVAHASGHLRAAPNATTIDASGALAELRTRCAIEMPAAANETGGLDPRDGQPAIRLWCGDGEALGHVEWDADCAPYRTHLTLLDVCASVARAAMSGQAADLRLTPTAVRELAMSQPLGPSVWIHARTDASSAGDREGVLATFVLFAEDGTRRGHADGVRFVRAGNIPSTAEFSSDCLYEVAWRRQDSAEPGADGPGLCDLAPVAAVDEAVQSRATHLMAEPAIEAYGDALRGLETLSTAFVVDALVEMGWRAAIGARITEAEVAHALGVVAGHRRLLRRLLEMLEEDGVLTATGSGWDVARALAPSDAVSEARALAGGPRVASHELILLRRCGEQLAGVLRGEVDPLELLFPGGSTEGTEQVYTASPVARLFNTLVGEAVTTIARSLPPDRRLRILEIGGGTGSTTSAILPVLPPLRTRYVFTDLSPLFLQRAAEKFAAHPFVEYAVYDAEREASGQSLPLAEFDLIVAANVLHATRDLRRTIERLTPLLSPGGMVLFAEATAPRRWLDLTFGLTEGWWRFDDRDLRPRHALLPRGAWVDLLGAIGFSGAVAMPHVAGSDDVLDGHTLIVAGAPPRTRAAESAEQQRRPWLILADAGGLGGAIARLLRAGGAECIEARAGEAMAQAADGSWTLDPTGPDGLARLMSEALTSAPTGVIDCWPLDAPPLEAASPESLERAAAMTCGSVLHAVQSLAGARADARLWVVTRHAVAAVPEDAAHGAVQAPVWGLGRVVALEHPDIWGGLIDVGEEDLDRTAARVVGRINTSDAEDQVALRPEGTFVPRIVPVRQIRTAPVTLRRDASYLVTGGTGGVGVLVACEMARQGAGHLVLVSRSGAPSRDLWESVASGSDAYRQVAALREIEALGATVTVLAADVAVPGQVSSLMETLRGLPPLAGVVHAAAHIESGKIRELTLDRLTTMLRPKVMGTWLLDRVTRDSNLDFFVLFSSTAGVFGATDLAHYAAANVFLDTFARARTRAGRPAVSIAWGTWAQIRGSDEAHRSIDRGGLKIMPRQRTLEAFTRLLNPARDHLVFADVDWSTLKPLYETRRRRPLFDEVGASAVKLAPLGPSAAPAVRERLRQARPAERRAVLLAHIRQEAAQVLALRPAQVDPRKGLFDLGMDSLMSVDLKGRLETSLGLKMPTTLTFNYPSVGAITDYVAELMIEPSPEAPAAVPKAIEPPSGDDLSEDELTTLLAAELEKMRR